MLSNNSSYYLQGLAMRFAGMLPLSPQKTMVDVPSPLYSEEIVDTAAFHRSSSPDDGLRYVLYFICDYRHLFGSSYNPFSNARNGLSCCSTFRRGVGFPKCSKIYQISSLQSSMLSECPHVNQVSLSLTGVGLWVS